MAKRIALFLALLLLLAACGRAEAPAETPVPSTVPATTAAPVTETPTAPPAVTSEAERAALLADFDAMMAAMAETFPYFSALERRLGVDLREKADDTRALIENYPASMKARAAEYGLAPEVMPALNAQVFWSILRHEFFPHFGQLAHAYTLSAAAYEAFRPIYSSPRSPFNTPTTYNAFVNPQSRGFCDGQAAIMKALPKENPALFGFFFGNPAPQASADAASATSVIDTEILEGGTVAYLAMPSFAASDWVPYAAALTSFYREIEGCDHLIIDIRDNAGGAPAFWRMLLMYPLWPEGKDWVDMPLYAFFRDTEQAMALAEIHIKSEAGTGRYRPLSAAPLEAAVLLDAHPMALMNPEDAATLGYVTPLDTSLGNITDHHFRAAGIAPMARTPFGGRIWLLTNENDHSAASLFAEHAKSMGFATLVGAPPRGSYSATYGAFFALPHSGIVVRWDVDYLTDAQGRALEELPTEPHHPCRPGLDALETALALIREGAQ